MDWDAFMALHEGLDRQGPGLPEDVAWAVSFADLPRGARICDAGAGTGADVQALLEAAPDAQVLALDKMPVFAAQLRDRFADAPRVQVEQGSMADLPGKAPFDMIWCAGALYFLGLEQGPRIMAQALKPGGVLAFSEPCYFVDSPEPEAVAFWGGYETQNRETILEATRAGGFEILADRSVSDTGWEAYYTPMDARIAALRGDETLTETLDDCAAEAARWRKYRAQTGYQLVVARKI